MRFLFTILFGLGLLTAASAGAQVSGDIQASFAVALEDAASKVLSRHLRTEAFQVIVTVKVDEAKLPRLPLNPGPTRESIIRSLPLERLVSLPDSILIEVLIDDSLNGTVRKRIEDILFKKLRLNQARGDKVKFSNLGIPLESTDLKAQLATSQRDLKDLTSKYEQLKKEDAQKAQAITDLKAESRLESNKVKDTPKPEASDGVFRAWLPFLLPLVLLMIGLSAGFSFFISSSRSSQTMAQAISAVAQSLPKLGEKIAAGAAVEQLPPLREQQSNSDTALAPNSNDQLVGLKQRLFELHDELNSSYSADTKLFITQHITQILKLEPSPTSAVLLMESLGKDKANDLFKALDPDSQAKVLAHMQSRAPEPRKYEHMLRLAEELKTLLVLHSMQSSQQTRDPRLAIALIRLNDTQLTELIGQLGERSLGRVLSYLPPAMVANLIKRLDDGDRGRLDALLEALNKLPVYALLSEEDATIQSVIQKVSARDDSQVMRYFSFFKELLEASDDSMADRIKAKLEQPALREFIEQNTINFGMFFRLADELFDEIAARLSVKDLALIFKHTDEVHRERLLKSATARKRELIEEEYAYIKDEAPRVSAVAFQSLRERILLRLRQLQREGRLELLNPAAPEAVSTPERLAS